MLGDAVGRSACAYRVPCTGALSHSREQQLTQHSRSPVVHRYQLCTGCAAARGEPRRLPTGLQGGTAMQLRSLAKLCRPWRAYPDSLAGRRCVSCCARCGPRPRMQVVRPERPRAVACGPCMQPRGAGRSQRSGRAGLGCGVIVSGSVAGWPGGTRKRRGRTSSRAGTVNAPCWNVE